MDGSASTCRARERIRLAYAYIYIYLGLGERVGMADQEIGGAALPPLAPPSHVRRLRHRHRLGKLAHVRHRVGWRGQVLGQELKRAAGDREHGGSN